MLINFIFLFNTSFNIQNCKIYFADVKVNRNQASLTNLITHIRDAETNPSMKAFLIVIHTSSSKINKHLCYQYIHIIFSFSKVCYLNRREFSGKKYIYIKKVYKFNNTTNRLQRIQQLK